MGLLDWLLGRRKRRRGGPEPGPVPAPGPGPGPEGGRKKRKRKGPGLVSYSKRFLEFGLLLIYLYISYKIYKKTVKKLDEVNHQYYEEERATRWRKERQ
ncbi:hypothetical protein [Haladaptatus sp. NG-WS-4]